MSPLTIPGLYRFQAPLGHFYDCFVEQYEAGEGFYIGIVVDTDDEEFPVGKSFMWASTPEHWHDLVVLTPEQLGEEIVVGVDEILAEDELHDEDSLLLNSEDADKFEHLLDIEAQLLELQEEGYFDKICGIYVSNEGYVFPIHIVHNLSEDNPSHSTVMGDGINAVVLTQE